MAATRRHSGTTSCPQRDRIGRSYFEPSPDSGAPVSPTKAHLDIARLCAADYIRVILTTNFDRLLERGLEEAEIGPQVIPSTAALSGMTPLLHAPATIIKLHGDYTMLGMRNTAGELSVYPPGWHRLLARIFDEYGLLVVGRSALYGTALVDALQRVRSRRYPMFWAAHHGRLEEPARRIIAQHTATLISVDGADEFFADVAERVDRLAQATGRRQRLKRLRITKYSPHTVPLLGLGSSIPLLQIRAAVVARDGPDDTYEPIRQRDRERIQHALQSSALTHRLRVLATKPSALATGGSIENSPLRRAVQLSDWVETPGGDQGEAAASYRLGSDGIGGISCLAEVRTSDASVFNGGTNAVFIADTGVSILDKLSLVEVAELLRDAITLAARSLPDTLLDALPPDVRPIEAEVHLSATTSDGHGQDPPKRPGTTHRPSSVRERIGRSRDDIESRGSTS